MQLPDPLGHRFTAHHHFQVARVIQVPAQPVAGADPSNLAVDFHGLAVDHPRIRDKALLGLGQGDDLDVHVGQHGQAFEVGQLQRVGVPVGHHQLDRHATRRCRTHGIVDHCVVRTGLVRSVGQWRIVQQLHAHFVFRFAE